MPTLAKNSDASSSEDASSPTLPAPAPAPGVAGVAAGAQVSVGLGSREFEPENSDVDFRADPGSLGWRDDPPREDTGTQGSARGGDERLAAENIRTPGRRVAEAAASTGAEINGISALVRAAAAAPQIPVEQMFSVPGSIGPTRAPRPSIPPTRVTLRSPPSTPARNQRGRAPPASSSPLRRSPRINPPSLSSPRRSPRVQRQLRPAPPRNEGAATAHIRSDAPSVLHTAQNPFHKPNKFNGKLGANAIVTAKVEHVYPRKPLRDHFQNNYKNKRMRFKVLSLQKRTLTGGRQGISLVVKFLAGDGPPDAEGKEWWVSHTQCRLLSPGPPNQYFFPKKVGRSTKKRGRAANSAIAPRPNPMQAGPWASAQAESDGDESGVEDLLNLEEQEAPVPPRTTRQPTRANIDERYNIRWDAGFQREVVMDGRGMREETKPRMAGVDNPSVLSELDYALKFLPTDFMKNVLLPATNQELVLNGKKPTTMPEFLGWLGMWIVISLHPGYNKRDFFNKDDRTYCWNPPYLGNFMSRNRFEAISAAIKLSNDPVPAHRDRFFWIRKMCAAFNAETKKVFVPGWLNVVDESMAEFSDPYAPGWGVVSRKPHPMGNEYHTTADCFCRVIFHIEMVEGKDRPKDGPYSKAEYEEEFGSKIAALCVRMTEGLHGSGRCIILDSGFGYVPAVIQLKAHGLFATAYIKKHAYWPKYTEAQEAINEMQGKDVGVISVRRGTYPSGTGGRLEEIYLVAQADSKHTSLMLSNWGTTQRVGRKKVRRVGGELVEFLFSKFQHYYYLGRHGVDDNNCERQDSCPSKKHSVQRTRTFDSLGLSLGYLRRMYTWHSNIL